MKDKTDPLNKKLKMPASATRHCSKTFITIPSETWKRTSCCVMHCSFIDKAESILITGQPVAAKATLRLRLAITAARWAIGWFITACPSYSPN
ncbi:hypothetical protein [Flavisolibacter ginsenosidimutans]|uniref:hypothetical protein n=1 Tax=Flavisolibacter ginsenosidimutans TaxID=661481 RepID=UPI001D156630|nr:hypothetical protein [Flavisolibacter ginsenosidimutans]